MNIRLEILKDDDIESFVRDNQDAFNFGAAQHFNESELQQQMEEDGEIISRKTILDSIHQKGSITYRIMMGDKKVGGIIINLKDDFGDLEIFFVNITEESRGIGQAAWKEIERLHPKVKVWETVTPYFEKRNIYFYVNKLGFHIVEYYPEFDEDKRIPSELDGMFRFRKNIA